MTRRSPLSVSVASYLRRPARRTAPVALTRALPAAAPLFRGYQLTCERDSQRDALSALRASYRNHLAAGFLEPLHSGTPREAAGSTVARLPPLGARPLGAGIYHRVTSPPRRTDASAFVGSFFRGQASRVRLPRRHSGCSRATARRLAGSAEDAADSSFLAVSPSRSHGDPAVLYVVTGARGLVRARGRLSSELL